MLEMILTKVLVKNLGTCFYEIHFANPTFYNQVQKE